MLNLKELFLYSEYAWKVSFIDETRYHRYFSTRTDVHVVRELTFEEGKPGILPDLQRLSRCPGSFTKLMIKTKMGDREVLSEDIITRVKGLLKMRAVDEEAIIVSGHRQMELLFSALPT
ncbi:hypothetical protein ARMGADRAFT_1035285 [Armillaria gallica]|uniref:Uncharacterized protein n=1 Tax=Armillaria gallica TaxID=47427 RepID=A0A2H3DGY8_ARMGA|nr:hypothetical protein ARMGADRAFT_1035285 [Armillaria gallica]